MIRALADPLRRLLALPVAACALALAAGCGQKGPLKLPEPPPAKPANLAP